VIGSVDQPAALPGRVPQLERRPAPGAPPADFGQLTGRADLGRARLLLQGPEDRAGALSFGLGPAAPGPVRRFNLVLQLAELRRAAQLLKETGPGEAVPEQVAQLTDPGTSLGGARSKNVVEDDDAL